MNIAKFIAKWGKAELKESSAAHQHFLDLCRVFEHPSPAEADPKGEWFTFEKGAAKHGGGDGWADVWKRGFFGWEYKGKRKDLDAAYDQLLQYREALQNPPLLVVCDLDRIVVHTNFTGTKTEIHDIPLTDLGKPRNFEIVRSVFHKPENLKPGTTSEAITTEAASRVADIAQALRDRGLPPPDVAHYLDRVVFCLFAEDVGLLPANLFTRLLEKSRHDPERFAKLTGDLFEAMARGGDFGVDTIRRFNGNLFEPGPILTLELEEIESLYAAALLDWAAVDPSVLGTLFERGLDPAKRAQLGAHYTSRQDIETLVDPVVMQPLRREWSETQTLIENLLTTGKKKPKGDEEPPEGSELKKARTKVRGFLRGFLKRLSELKVLDPACGSGNFLYVTLQKLKDLEKEVLIYGMERDFPAFIPLVGPWQLHGIEINRYAFELAQMTLWIGYLQWVKANGFPVTEDPILRPMDTFECKDAILDLSDPENPEEPEWPKVDFIVGNPPFLGSRLMRAELGDEYCFSLFSLYQRRLGGRPDLVCYWFERARTEVAAGRCHRAGLLATQGIRGGTNRKVLKRIKETGEIFFAESDRPWVLDGANVHVSMVGFHNGKEKRCRLDGKDVEVVNSNLTSGPDVTEARALSSNAGIAFQGPIKRGPFDTTDERALGVLQAAGNPHSRPNSDVVFPYLNASDLTKRPRRQWVIDFGERGEAEAAKYQVAFDHLRQVVKPARQKAKQSSARVFWWRHWRTRPAMNRALASLPRYLCTTGVSKHRVFVWKQSPAHLDHAVFAFARSDDYFFGVLQSRLHEVWALRLGTRLETRPRYTPTTCFETFSIPWPTEGQKETIAEAARELNELRERWLDPPEWTREEVLEFPGSVDGPWKRYVPEAGARGIGTVRYPRVVAKDDDCAESLALRTLTNLYNKRPTWLDLAHKKLDEAVFTAYGWSPDLADEEILEKLLALNLERAAAEA